MNTSISSHLIMVALILLFISCGSKDDIGPPNLVLIIADDLGYNDVGFNGSEEIPTPNIDRIAHEGVRFTNGYVTWAACGPSRAGLITGRYQDRFGFSRNPLFTPNDPTMGLPVSEQTLPDVLHQADYMNAALGKWHLGAHPSQRPQQRGFDDFFGFLTGGHRYFPEEWTLEDEYEVTRQYDAYKTKLLRNDERIEENEYLTDALSREAVGYIEKYQDNPFFIYLAYNAPHGPLQATDKYLERFDHIDDEKRQTYCAMVSAVDDGVGRVLDKLDQLGLSENTMVIFISDNGGPKHIMADNTPLRGYKGDLFEGGIRVPFAMRWPAQITAGMEYEEPVITLDIFATMAARIKDVQLKNDLDGVDLLPHLIGQDHGPPHDALFWRRFDQRKIAVRHGNTKLLNLEDESFLFDLANDASEQDNLFAHDAATLSQLEQKIESWKQEMIDPIFFGLYQDSLYNTMHPDRFTRPTGMD